MGKTMCGNNFFSVLHNESPVGFIRGERGLHQGDSLSPYLFTLVTEAFLLMLKLEVIKASKEV